MPPVRQIAHILEEPDSEADECDNIHVQHQLPTCTNNMSACSFQVKQQTNLFMVSEMGECIPCFPDNRGRFGATGSDLGMGMRKFVKAEKDFNIP